MLGFVLLLRAGWLLVRSLLTWQHSTALHRVVGSFGVLLALHKLSMYELWDNTNPGKDS